MWQLLQRLCLWVRIAAWLRLYLAVKKAPCCDRTPSVTVIAAAQGVPFNVTEGQIMLLLGHAG